MLLLTAEEMRRLDRATIESGHASGEQLMERAGKGVVEAMERLYGPLLGFRVLVLCGPGNNGGDGMVAARHLIARGAVPQVGVLGERGRIRGEALAHLQKLEAEDSSLIWLGDEAGLARLTASRDEWDFALDALLGTGARGAPEGLIAAAVQTLRELDEAGTRVVALDLPTGVHADSGEIARRAVRADLTVTFGYPKRGHYLYPGRAFVGTLEVVDIGLLPPPAGSLAYPVELASVPELAVLLKARDPRAHKGSVGRVLVIGGSEGLSGAVALAARAASRAGAGYVQMAVPESLHHILEIKLTEEMTLPLPETPDHSLALAALEPLRSRAAAADVTALGSGLSRAKEAAELVRQLALAGETPLVIDADGLNAFAGHAGMLAQIPTPRVLTPHLGEMSRLTGLDPASLEATRIDAAREWAVEWKSVVVLKGAPTVTGSPEGRATVNPTGNPGMATAGMGDVLTGAIAALMAQGLDPYDAARIGVLAHGLAGDLAASELGPIGLTASDVLERLPRALATLARERDGRPTAPRRER